MIIVAAFAYQIEQTLAATAIYVDVFTSIQYTFAPFRILEARDSQSEMWKEEVI